MMKTYRIIGKFTLCLVLISFLIPVFCTSAAAKAAVTVKVVRNTSVEALLKAEGYDLKDEDIVGFLREFSGLNPQLKTLSMLPKGTTVRLPQKHIVRHAARVKKQVDQQIYGKQARRPSTRETDRAKALNIIERLASALGEGIAVDKEGIKAFSSGAAVTFSLDTDYFPLLYTGGKKVILDYQGILPPDIEGIMEVLWPEYRIVRTGGDMKNLVPSLLDLLGYSSSASGKVVLGDGMQVEIYPDFTAFRKTDALAGGPFTLIMILRQDEFRIPDELKILAQQRDIRIIEIPSAEQALPGRAAHTVDMRIHDRKNFLERFLTLTGYSFRKEASLSLSERKEYSLEIKADFLLGSGKNMKIIDFSDALEPYKGYLRKKGIEMLSLRQNFNRSDIVLKTAQFLNMRYETDFRRTSSLLTPKNRRFKVIVPGIFISRESGRYFWPEPGIDTTLLGSLMSDSVRLIRH